MSAAGEGSEGVDRVDVKEEAHPPARPNLNWLERYPEWRNCDERCNLDRCLSLEGEGFLGSP